MKHILTGVLKVVGLLTLVFGSQEALAQEFRFQVEHQHMFKSCTGELIINQNGVEFQTERKDHARKWTYTDIKMLKLVSPNEIAVLSYENSLRALGSDRTFDFKVLTGGLNKEVSDFVLARVDRPVATNFVATEGTPRYEIPVRHRHRFGGCHGTLRIFSDKVIYDSNSSGNSRYWRVTEIKSIGRSGPYQFGITTYEPQFGGLSKAYNFDLKERMDDAQYDYLWTRVYRVPLAEGPETEQ